VIRWSSAARTTASPVNVALETGGVLVSDKVTLEFEVSLIKTA
jgi:hypothetical protein